MAQLQELEQLLRGPKIWPAAFLWFVCSPGPQWRELEVCWQLFVFLGSIHMFCYSWELDWYLNGVIRAPGAPLNSLTSLFFRWHHLSPRACKTGMRSSVHLPVTLLRADIWKDKREGNKGKYTDYLVMMIKVHVYKRCSTKVLMCKRKKTVFQRQKHGE